MEVSLLQINNTKKLTKLLLRVEKLFNMFIEKLSSFKKNNLVYQMKAWKLNNFENF